MSWPVLVLDVETIPDIAGLRDAPAEASDAEVHAAWLAERKENGQSDFMPLHLQRVLVISCVFRNAEGLRIHSFADRDFKWNNYISRYHMRHLDLMDLMALYQPKNNAPLDAMAKLCGFPGKLGMDGSAVYPAYRDGKLEDIRCYCETDVMNTYWLYCRFQQMRGGFTEKEYAQEIALIKQTLGNLASEQPHWDAYLQVWA